MKQSFPKQLRLLKREDFRKVAAAPNVFHYVGKYLILDACSNEIQETRIGITVTTRYGDAHERNRFKRLVREAFRLNYSHLKKSLDIIIKPRFAAKQAKMQDIAKELLDIADKLNFC